MPNDQKDKQKTQGSAKQGGTHEQHVKAGEKSHQNGDDKKGSGNQGGQSQKTGQQKK